MWMSPNVKSLLTIHLVLMHKKIMYKFELQIIDQWQILIFLKVLYLL